MKYISTRNKNKKVSAAEAILKGIADDGGLFVPESFPVLQESDFFDMLSQSYPERAAFVIGKYLTDYSREELLDYCEKAYSKFDGDPCPLINIDNITFIMELWHGPTAAFKDMALTLLPHLLTAARKKCGVSGKTLILTATSGDTGKAALEGFKDVDGTDIIVFYPADGVSVLQERQMKTQEGKNVKVIGMRGNFDDTQNAVKRIFTSSKLREEIKEKGYEFSSANSINWGRLVPQIAYYVSAYCDLLGAKLIKKDEKVNFCVPTGNFGNILAAYYAMKMGVPVNKLICASNINNVLTDFLGSGVYDANREFYRTMSPSMDILISSNFERLLFEILGRNDKAVAEKMAQLKESGKYEIPAIEVVKKASEFIGGFAEEDEALAAIGNFYEAHDYVLDPHTGVAAAVYNSYSAKTKDETKTVITATASPYKFPSDVYDALTGSLVEDEFKALKKLRSFTGENIPEPLLGLDKKRILHDRVIDKEEAARAVTEYVDYSKG